MCFMCDGVSFSFDAHLVAHRVAFLIVSLLMCEQFAAEWVIFLIFIETLVLHYQVCTMCKLSMKKTHDDMLGGISS